MGKEKTVKLLYPNKTVEQSWFAHIGPSNDGNSLEKMLWYLRLVLYIEKVQNFIYLKKISSSKDEPLLKKD